MQSQKTYDKKSATSRAYTFSLGSIEVLPKTIAWTLYYISPSDATLTLNP